MDEIIEIVNQVDGQCMRHLHLMSNREFDRASMTHYAAVNGVVTREAGVWHLRAIHPFRGVMDVNAEGWVKMRRLVMWSLDGYPTVKVALHAAAAEFERVFHGRAMYGFVRRLPRGAEHGMDVEDLTLLEADWMLERAVAVGGWCLTK